MQPRVSTLHIFSASTSEDPGNYARPRGQQSPVLPLPSSQALQDPLHDNSTLLAPQTPFEESNWPSAYDVAQVIDDPTPHALDAEFLDEFCALIQIQDAPLQVAILDFTAEFLCARFKSIPTTNCPDNVVRPRLNAKRKQYVRMQHLFHKDRSKLVEAITGTEPVWSNPPRLVEIHHILRQRLNKPSALDDAPFAPKVNVRATTQMPLVSIEEVIVAQKAMPSCSTPGPDDMSAMAAKSIPPSLLCKIFGSLRIAARVPAHPIMQCITCVTFCSDGRVSAGANPFIGVLPISTNLLAADLVQRYWMHASVLGLVRHCEWNRESSPFVLHICYGCNL
uniref:Uncharacterized protein n=1 Tax=Trichuris muris TaxID=70415 RepID=A0A5S6Q1D3_TRIMR